MRSPEPAWTRRCATHWTSCTEPGWGRDFRAVISPFERFVNTLSNLGLGGAEVTEHDSHQAVRISVAGDQDALGLGVDRKGEMVEAYCCSAVVLSDLAGGVQHVLGARSDSAKRHVDESLLCGLLRDFKLAANLGPGVAFLPAQLDVVPEKSVGDATIELSARSWL